jgi:hypothetical protein
LFYYAQMLGLKKVYDGVRNSKGALLYPGQPPGAEIAVNGRSGWMGSMGDGDAANAAIFAAARKKAKKTARGLSAPFAAPFTAPLTAPFTAIEVATKLPFDQGCLVERRLLKQLAESNGAFAAWDKEKGT